MKRLSFVLMLFLLVLGECVVTSPEEREWAREKKEDARYEDLWQEANLTGDWAPLNDWGDGLTRRKRRKSLEDQVAHMCPEKTIPLCDRWSVRKPIPENCSCVNSRSFGF